jgi:hydrogenase large subunit
MAQRVVIDPMTRIEGHLRVQAIVDGNVVKDASCTSALFRGIEIILRDRDPREAWALAERICGVCTLVHAVTSVRAIEDALKIEIPKNANLIRNIMIATLFVHDHVVHFYHLHALDWVDVVSALKANPKATAELAQKISNWPKSSVGYFTDVQNRLKKFVESGQLGIFANAYWGHPGYKLPPEVNLLAVAHYIEALNWQKEIVKIHAVFGGKNPHPNLIVGGMPCAINLNHPNAINIDKLADEIPGRLVG